MRRRDGFTLVEVLTVVCIIAFGLLPIIGLLSSATRQEALDESVVIAQGIALRLSEQTVEGLERNGFAKGQTSGGPEAVPLAPGRYTWEVTVDTLDPEAYLWSISIRVRWALPTDTAPDPSHVFALERLVSRPEAAFTGGYPYRRQMEVQ